MTPLAKKILSAQRKAAAFPCLIKIAQNGYPDMFFANASEDITYDGEIYNAASFSVQPPDTEGAKIGAATLTISAIDQYWIQRMRETQTPATLQFVAAIVYDDDQTVIGIEPLESYSFTLRAANWDALSISWEMSFDERQGIVITSAKCTAQIAPGCA